MQMSWDQWMEGFQDEETGWRDRTLIAALVAVGDAYAHSLAVHQALLETGPAEYDVAMDRAIEAAAVASNEAMALVFDEVGLPTLADRFRNMPRTGPLTARQPD